MKLNPTKLGLLLSKKVAFVLKIAKKYHHESDQIVL